MSLLVGRTGIFAESDEVFDVFALLILLPMIFGPLVVTWLLVGTSWRLLTRIGIIVLSGILSVIQWILL